MELKNHGWALDEIGQLTLSQLNNALLWIQNNKARKNNSLFAVAQYHLLAQNKKTKMNAEKLLKQATKTKEIDPAKRPTLIEQLQRLANNRFFKK